MSQYTTNLTDKQWQVTENILDPQQRNESTPSETSWMPSCLYWRQAACGVCCQGLSALQYRLLLLQQVETWRRVWGTDGYAPSDGPQADGREEPPVSASLIPEASSPPIMLTPIVGSTATRGLKGARNILCLTHLGFLWAWWFTRRMSMTVSVRMALLTRWRAASPDWKRCSGGRRIQRTGIGRYRTPKARCGVYRCSPSGRVSEEILRAATPEDCGALFRVVGKLSKNCHWSRVLFRYGRGEGSARLLPTHV